MRASPEPTNSTSSGTPSGASVNDTVGKPEKTRVSKWAAALAILTTALSSFGRGARPFEQFVSPSRPMVHREIDENGRALEPRRGGPGTKHSRFGGNVLVLIAHSFFLQRDPKQRERHKPYSPLTTLLAVAMLRERGHPVALFDATFHDGPAAFEAALDRTDAGVLLLIEDNFNFLTKMCTETRREDALAMVRAASRRGLDVAVNGPDASDHPRLYLEAGASAVLTGEGEFAAADFVDAARGGSGSLEQVGGLILLDDNGTLRRTPQRRERTDLDELPFPAWDLLDAEAYRSAWNGAHGHLSWNIAASRGCPYSCNWCAKPTFGRRYSQRSPASVAEEMQRLKAEVRPDHIWFADDIFGMTAEWVGEFAEEVARRGAALPFTMQSRVNLISQPVAEALRAAGAEEVWLGVESGSQRVLDAMDKGSQVHAARTATRNLRRVGIRAAWFLQLGYPPEDWEDIVLTRDLVHEEMPDDVGVSVAYPLPGTPFHERLAAELGPRRNWRDTAELAMLFRGTFDTVFYRMVRDALHADVTARRVDGERWRDLARRAGAHRSAPLSLPA
jgi:anaerobic magnesium-protoporphyrin IX monomethyl ester cyclase